MNSKSNILLIGLPGCGKSTVGRSDRRAALRRAARYGRDGRVDDWAHRQRAVCRGGGAFATQRPEACRLLAQRRHTVIAAGGRDCWSSGNGIWTCCAKAAGSCLPRSQRAGHCRRRRHRFARPLLSQGTGQVFVLEQERRPLYLAAADWVLAGNLAPMEAAQRICRWAREGMAAREEHRE